MNAVLRLACPAMEVNSLAWNLRETAAEPMEAILNWDDGTSTIIPKVTIPKTLVKRQGFLSWMVDACKGTNDSPEWNMVVSLPKEPTVWEWGEMNMVAQPIDAPVFLQNLTTGRIWRGEVKFPRCVTNIWVKPALAEKVTALGTLTEE